MYVELRATFFYLAWYYMSFEYAVLFFLYFGNILEDSNG